MEASVSPKRLNSSGDKTNSHVNQERPGSPVPSCVSMKSDRSMGLPIHLKGGLNNNQEVPLDSPDSPVSSMVSMKSERSKGLPIHFQGDFKNEKIPRPDSPVPSCVSMKSDRLMGLPTHLKGDSDKDEDFQMKTTSPEPTYYAYGPPMIPLEAVEATKSHLRRKFQYLLEGTATQGQTRLFNEIYTDLYITEGGEGEVNKEHEVRQIETASRRAEAEDIAIKCTDIFKPLPGQSKPLRTVLTKGVAGIGKTVSVQKFILDWADGKANQDVQFIFPLAFRELNLIKEKNLSLLQLLQHLFREQKDIQFFRIEEHKVVFIFDGLDEYRSPLDFHNSKPVTKVEDPVSVDTLLTNLIKGNLLPSALLWITTRPGAADKIPFECVDRVTEIQGFNDFEKKEYFRKRISDENLAKRAISHLKSSRSLYIMCHIPVLCWISATVLERMFTEASSGEIPKSLTQMYIHFLIIQMEIREGKYTDTDEEMIFRLGKLAFQQLEKGNLIFYEEDLRECGIDITEASVYSGVCTQIFREESVLYQRKVFSFVHLSIQEFLAAVHVHVSFTIKGKNVLRSDHTCPLLHDLHKVGVDLALESEDGHLDLFIRFLLGLSLESNQKNLDSLLKNAKKTSLDTQETSRYIKQKIEECWTFTKMLNLFHCLNELNDTSMVKDIQEALLSGHLPWPSETTPSNCQCASLMYLLLTAEEGKYDFHLNRIIKTDECIEKTIPVIKALSQARLGWCRITSRSCEQLGLVLTQSSSLIRELDLSGNKIQDCGVEKLSRGLENPKCKLKQLKLTNCSLTERSCAILASVLSTGSSLRELNLSGNRIQDAGVKLFTDGLKSTCCKLKVLRLHNCGLTDESCFYLAAALRSNPSHLRELHLSVNTLGESGEEPLEALRKDPHCSLKILTTKPQKSWC
ncbi:NACHT, LRR and PYD domains-containing protein 3-like [Alosa pseudoharengus]|uniref:NACHT, LRR and PYD domains-containing protein 3-like n=1 Tax=Alosa pseudoharengus TaxID=34774 RepID=UPI003F88B5EC